MKKSEILNALYNEDCSVVNLVVRDTQNELSLAGSSYLPQAIRMIEQLPSKFYFDYIPIE